MEGHAIDHGHKEERPMRAAFCDRDVACIIYGKEDMGRSCKVGKCFFEGEGVGRLHEHESH